MLVCVLVVTYIIASLTAVFYQQRSTLGDDTTIPRSLMPILYVIIFVIGFVLTFGIIYNFLGNAQYWNILLGFQVVFEVLTPITIISTSSQIKDYFKERFQASTMFVNKLYEKYCARRSPQFSPMEG